MFIIFFRNYLPILFVPAVGVLSPVNVVSRSPVSMDSIPEMSSGMLPKLKLLPMPSPESADAIAGSAVVIAAVVVVVPGSKSEAGSGCESKLGSRCGFGFNFRSGS